MASEGGLLVVPEIHKFLVFRRMKALESALSIQQDVLCPACRSLTARMLFCAIPAIGCPFNSQKKTFQTKLHTVVIF